MRTERPAPSTQFTYLTQLVRQGVGFGMMYIGTYIGQPVVRRPRSLHPLHLEALDTRSPRPRRARATPTTSRRSLLTSRP
jgi:hypothetical protein